MAAFFGVESVSFKRSFLRGFLLLLVCTGAAVACARQKAEMKGVQSRPPDDLTALEREMDSAEARIDGVVGQRLTLSLDKDGATRPDEPAPPPPKESVSEAPAEEAAATPRRAETAPSPCETACKALASMRRSADRICEIVGEPDARCSRARERVDESSTRVEKAGCVCDADAGP